jgi:uncharacterized repeat protein (TIGR03803 family)
MRITPSGPVRLTLALFVIAFMCAGSAGAATEKILHSFEPYWRGKNPNHGVLVDAAGNLYGTTWDGGLAYGNVYKLAPNSQGGWTEHAVYNFTGFIYGTDGDLPQGGLISDQAGNLYGTTSLGGPNNCGAVYELTPGARSWTVSVLYSFTGGADGCYPGGA